MFFAVSPLRAMATLLTPFEKWWSPLEFAVVDHVSPLFGMVTLMTPARKRLG